MINSDSDIIMEVISEGVDSDDAEIQLEENIRMDAGGKIDLYAKSSGEDADDAQIQIKKVSDELLLDGNKEFALAPNITAVNDILIKAESTDEAEIQIEESNFLQSGNAIKLSGLGASGEGEVETKKFVQLVAGSDITLEVTGSEAELTIDENNVFDANSGAGTITLNAGGGELEIKSGTTFNPTPPTIIP